MYCIYTHIYIYIYIYICVYIYIYIYIYIGFHTGFFGWGKGGGKRVEQLMMQNTLLLGRVGLWSPRFFKHLCTLRFASGGFLGPRRLVTDMLLHVELNFI